MVADAVLEAEPIVRALQGAFARGASRVELLQLAASHIRAYKLQGAVNELKSLLTTSSENVRMSAAYALVVVGGDEGREAVEKAIPNEENEIVSTFYRSILAQPSNSVN